MSRKRVFQKHIEKGRFYHVHEGSKTGHPGFVFWKNDKKNIYFLLTTDLSNGPHRTKLSKKIDPKGSVVGYINNRPLIAKRKDIGGQRCDFRFDKTDRALLQIISLRKWRFTKNVTRKDYRYLCRLKKKPRY